MRGNNEQVSACSIAACFGDSRARIASVLSSPQPQEVHAASAVCLFGAEELSQNRLPGSSCSACRLSVAAGCDFVATSSALHDVAKGNPVAVGQRPGQTLARGHDPRPLWPQ